MAFAGNVDALLAHGEWVRELVRHLVFDRDLADDVEQQTWLAALEHAPERIESPRGWLAQVARRFAFQAHRKDARRNRAEPLAAKAEAWHAPDVERRIELHRILVDAIASLESPYRTVVVMRYFEGLAPRDIAARLGLPATTVRNRLSRALEQLRTRFDAQHGDRKAWATALMPLALAPKSATAAPIAVAGVAALLLGAAAVLVLALRPAASEAAPGTHPAGREVSATLSPVEAGVAGAPSSPRRVAAAPSAPRAGPAPASAVPALRGRVVRSDGAPAAGAAVSILRPLRRRANADDWFTRAQRQFEPTIAVASAVADEAGEFSIAGVDPGSYDVLAEIRGEGRAVADSVELVPGAGPLSLTLAQVDVVPCVAVDANGAPVAGVEVAVHHQRSFDPHFNRPRTEVFLADDAGRFAIVRARGNLSDARLVMIDRFQGSGWWQQVSLRKRGYAPVFSAPLNQQPIDEDGRVVFVMQRGRRFEIGFRSDDLIDDPIRCMLRVDSANFEAVAVTNEAHDAVFEDVPEGTIAGLILDTPGWALMRDPVVEGTRSRFCARRYRIPKTGDLRTEIVIHRGASVGGMVVDDATGAPIAGVELVAFPNAGYLASRSHCVRAVSDAQGRFAISGLTAIWNELRVAARDWHAPAPLPTASMPEAPDGALPRTDALPPLVATRRSDALALLVLPNPEEPIRDLVIRVRRTGRAAGRIVDEAGAPVAGAVVSVERGEEAMRLWPAPLTELMPAASAVTDALGRFELIGVPPGSRRLVARAPGRAPAFSEPFALEPGGTAVVADVTVRPGAPVTIRVRSNRGRPVAGIGVKIYADRFPREFVGPDDFAGCTGPDGAVVVRSLAAGPICLAVENATSDGLVLAPSFRSTYEHDPARPLEIVVEMVEPAAIRGVVLLEDGTPLAHATLFASPESVTRDDFNAIEDVIGRGPLDWNRAGAEAGLREISGVRVRTDAAGAFTARVNSGRTLVVRRVERWRRGDAQPAETYEPVDAGATLIPDGPAAPAIVVRRNLSPTKQSPRR